MHPFLRYISLNILLLLFTSCASVSLVDSWQGAAPGGRTYHRLLIVGMLKDRKHRLACEEKTAAILQQQGIVAFTSREFIGCEVRPSFQALAEAVEKSGADAVLTIHPVDMEPNYGNEWERPTLENVSSYPGYWLPTLFPRWDLYSHYRSAAFFDPPAHAGAIDFLIQINLFEAENKRLVWAGKLALTTPEKLPMEDASVAELIMETLVENGLVSTPLSREPRLLAEQQTAPAHGQKSGQP